MQQINFNVHLDKAAKKQALELMPLLKQVLPIERAKMRLIIYLDPALPDCKE